MDCHIANQVRSAAVLCAALIALPVHAPARADLLGESGMAFAELSVLNDDNLYRREANRERASRVRFGAGISTLLQPGQQQLQVSAGVHDNRFENAEELDYVGGSFDVALDWQLGRRVDGVFEYRFLRDMTGFDRLRQGLERDITTSNESRASVGYFVMPRLQLRAEIGGMDWAHSAAEWRASELEETQYGINVMFRTRPGTFFGIGTRRHDGRYPHRMLTTGAMTDRAYEQVNSALIVEWHAGGRTSLDARIGYTSREQETFSQRNFDATTGELSVEYAMSAKTELTLLYSRDIRSIDEAVSRAALVDTVDFSPVWNVSRNTRVRFRAIYRQEDFRGVTGLDDVNRVDEAFDVEGQLLYTLRDRLSLVLSIGRGSRNSTLPGLDYDYGYGNVGVRVTL